ncbi:hypothetical protein RSOE_08655 [Ralstonia solanacearum OE1-1]|nr:hypothetical protein RSOE_08655 [Ralstonia solanacearum OE1-1]
MGCRVEFRGQGIPVSVAFPYQGGHLPKQAGVLGKRNQRLLLVLRNPTTTHGAISRHRRVRLPAQVEHLRRGILVRYRRKIVDAGVLVVCRQDVYDGGDFVLTVHC